MKRLFLIASVLSVAIIPAFAQNSYDDDIYYNPKKDKALKTKKVRKSNYIPNMAEMDVDEYNGRGNFTPFPVDTIGQNGGNGEDFVYTQQIQKYYNPTVVVDNAAMLGDVLSRSYGNVNIVIDCDNIMFEPWYRGYYPSITFYSPFTRWGYGNYYWGIGPGFSWGVSWTDPWFTNPIYNPWGWNWAWNWGPSWGHVWRPRPGWDFPRYAPHGNRRTGINTNWAHNPNRYYGGGNYRGTNHHSGSSFGNRRPGTTGNRRTYSSISNPNAISTAGRPGSSVTTVRPGNNKGYYLNQQGHRVIGNGATQQSSTTINRNSYNMNNRTNNSYNGNRRQNNVPQHYNNYNPGSYNHGSYNHGGSYGGGNRGGGGGGRGRHR